GDGRKAHLLALLGREGLRVDNGVVEQDLDLRDDLIARIDVEGDVNLVGDVVEVHRDVRGTSRHRLDADRRRNRLTDGQGQRTGDRRVDRGGRGDRRSARGDRGDLTGGVDRGDRGRARRPGHRLGDAG